MLGRASLDMGLRLIDDRLPPAFACGVVGGVMRVDDPAGVKDADDDQEEDRQDEGEFNQGLAPAPSAQPRAYTVHGLATLTVMVAVSEPAELLTLSCAM